MKTPDQIRKRLEEYREKRLEKDKAFRNAIEIGKLEESSIFFEALVTLEGGIDALKWALEESKILED